MEAERAAEVKRVLPRLLLGLVAVESFTLPIFRSGGRTELSFWEWVVNHTIFGPPVEYVPEEDYSREMQGIFPWNPVEEQVKTFENMEVAMAYFKCGEASLKELLESGAISIIAGNGSFQRYDDLLANVRYDGNYHSVRGLVQVNDPDVRDIARVLVQAKDFVAATQEFVHSFTTYKAEVGDYWAEPGETLAAEAGDCDDKAILLCSILRNYTPADKVYCAFGLWKSRGELGGHMWVVTEGSDGEDLIIEATAGPDRPGKGKYILHGMFNDQYAFSTAIGLREFDLKAVEIGAEASRR